MPQSQHSPNVSGGSASPSPNHYSSDAGVKRKRSRSCEIEAHEETELDLKGSERGRIQADVDESSDAPGLVVTPNKKARRDVASGSEASEGEKEGKKKKKKKKEKKEKKNKKHKKHKKHKQKEKDNDMPEAEVSGDEAERPSLDELERQLREKALRSLQLKHGTTAD